MIDFNFKLINPFNDQFDEIFAKDILLSRYKAITLCWSKTNEFLTVVFKLNFRQDHAGCFIELGLLYNTITFHFYDTRHWGVTNNCWG